MTSTKTSASAKSLYNLFCLQIFDYFIDIKLFSICQILQSVQCNYLTLKIFEVVYSKVTLQIDCKWNIYNEWLILRKFLFYCEFLDVDLNYPYFEKLCHTHHNNSLSPQCVF